MKKLAVVTFALVLPLSYQQAGQAQVQEGQEQANENWTQVNLSVTDNQVLPAYLKFEQSALLLNESAELFCQSLSNQSLLAFQQSYHSSMDAWQGIQHIQFGPITYFNWNFRLQYWPDNNGTGGRQLTAMIAAQDQDALISDNFARQSVGVQGFPALERLLFADNSLSAFNDDPYQCQVAQTIARNISEISTGVYERWRDEFRATVETAEERGFFESAEDATIDFLKGLVESVPRIQDQKLLPALGESFAGARERRGESWRSQRSLRNIKINLNTFSAFFNGTEESQAPLNEVSLNSVFLNEDVLAINVGFANIAATLADLPDSMVVALADEAQYQQLQTLLNQLSELDELLETALKNTDLYLGFNSLDGD